MLLAICKQSLNHRSGRGFASLGPKQKDGVGVSEGGTGQGGRQEGGGGGILNLVNGLSIEMFDSGFPYRLFDLITLLLPLPLPLPLPLLLFFTLALSFPSRPVTFEFSLVRLRGYPGHAVV